MNFEKNIGIYEAIADLTNQMLIAAKEQDWDKLADLESRSPELIQQLKDLKNSAPLSASANNSKLAIIKRILADDREIRNLISPRMAKLSELISGAQQGKKATRAYRQ